MVCWAPRSAAIASAERFGSGSTMLARNGPTTSTMAPPATIATPRRARVSGLASTSRCRQATSSAKPDSSFIALSLCCAASSRSVADTGTILAWRPISDRRVRLRSAMVRQRGERSILVNAISTLGADFVALTSSSSSADVSSQVASETSSTVSAWSRSAADAPGRLCPTTSVGGVSISTMPAASNCRGRPTSAVTTEPRSAGSALPLVWRATSSTGTGIRSGSDWLSAGSGPAPSAGVPAGRRSVMRTAEGSSACWMTVGAMVVRSSPTAQTDALTNAFTRWDLPCLAAPTTSTCSLGVSRRALRYRSRSARSPRSWARQVPMVSSNKLSQGGAITRIVCRVYPSGGTGPGRKGICTAESYRFRCAQ